MHLVHIAQRLLDTPLLVHPAKAEIILAVLAPRMGIAGILRADGSLVQPAALLTDDEPAYGAPGRAGEAGYDNLGGVAVIPVEGTLVQKAGSLRPWSGMTGYDGVRQNFLTALTDPDVNAIMLDIDSPGGEVYGLFDLVDTIHAARGTKPVWAVLDEIADSAAYAIASAADHITVPRTGEAGSIGVLLVHVDSSRALDAAGLTVRLITYGERKADGHPSQPLADEVAGRIQTDINRIGQMFVETVARNRDLSADAVRDMQADTFLGSEAVEQGLADEVMAPDEAFRALRATIASATDIPSDLLS
jgi:signal peptide peptidase SppA